ncbi:hypothetical protein [Syntrophotalea acetylenivorans]|uniref:hypothetical protein n=1 Tax=Syntrophotalea acetylenivorans TaxID=1842532 RepID=UPI001313E040|nr:hypothetical protein [Syntrophotalea acetylenivorans]
MNSLPKPVLRYCASRAIDGPWQITGNERHDFSMAVVVPALAESNNLPATLYSLAANPAEHLANTLILLVINQRPDSTAEEKEDNCHTLRELAAGSWNGQACNWPGSMQPHRAWSCRSRTAGSAWPVRSASIWP